MRTILFLFGALVLLSGCTKERDVTLVLEDPIAEYRSENVLGLQVSEREIILDPLKRREQAMLITWEPLREVEALYPVTYILKMDLSSNNFSQSIPSETMAEGVHFRVFTHEDLQELIRRHWQREGTDAQQLSIRVIAQVHNEEQFITPLVSTVDIRVLPFNLSSTPLFMFGSATGTTQPHFELNEELPGELYAWRGYLQAGHFRLSASTDATAPQFVPHPDGGWTELTDADDTRGFVIDQAGHYAVSINKVSEEVSVQEVPFLNVYFGGSGTPTAWNNPPALTWDRYQPHIGSITTNLRAGEIKFSTETNFSTGTRQLRPLKPDASIQTDLDVMAFATPDWKWRVQAEEAGNYRVRLNTKSMKVEFIKIN